MRYAIRRIHVWAAAKVGALLGCMVGFFFGFALVALGSVLAPFGQMLDQPFSPLGFSGVIVVTLTTGSIWCPLFALVAVFYNLVARAGAVVFITAEKIPDCVPAANSEAAREAGVPTLGSESLKRETFAR